MSILRMGSKLPSGEDGFYIYHNTTDDKLYLYAKDNGVKMTKKDVKFLIEKLQYAVERYWDE